MLDIGTKVRIKSWEEIQKTLDEDSKCDGVYFNSKMQAYCGKVCDIQSQAFNSYLLSNTDDFYWIPEWFDVVEGAVYLNDGSIEQRSLCLALIRQVMSGNEPHLSMFTPGTTCNTKSSGGFNYRDFPEDNWYRTIAENIPDWPCLNLKPEILEEAIKNCLSQHDLEYFKKWVSFNIDYWFIFNKTEKSGFWYKVVDTSITIHSEINKDINIEKPYKTKENEIKFQRRKSTVLRGTVPEGSQQSSGKCKATTYCGYLSYQVCTGR